MDDKGCGEDESEKLQVNHEEKEIAKAAMSKGCYFAKPQRARNEMQKGQKEKTSLEETKTIPEDAGKAFEDVKAENPQEKEEKSQSRYEDEGARNLIVNANETKGHEDKKHSPECDLNEEPQNEYQGRHKCLIQTRKGRVKRKKMEQQQSKRSVEMEARNDEIKGEALKSYHVEENKENETQESGSQRSDKTCNKVDEIAGDGYKKVEHVKIELRMVEFSAPKFRNQSVVNQGNEVGAEVNGQKNEFNVNDKIEVMDQQSDDSSHRGGKLISLVDNEPSRKSRLGRKRNWLDVLALR